MILTRCYEAVCILVPIVFSFLVCVSLLFVSLCYICRWFWMTVNICPSVSSLHLFNHLSATVMLTCCAVALTSYWSSASVFIFPTVSSITSFQPSTRSRYLSSDWLRILIDMRWFCMSRVSRLLVAFRVFWVWEAWSRTWSCNRDQRGCLNDLRICFFSLFYIFTN